MIPIKKIKAKIMAEFNSRSKDFDDRVAEVEFNKGTHYFNIPWGLRDERLVSGGFVTVRYDVRRNRFDRIKFQAFGQWHVIKL